MDQFQYGLVHYDQRFRKIRSYTENDGLCRIRRISL
jgi:hypothetical protein